MWFKNLGLFYSPPSPLLVPISGILSRMFIYLSIYLPSYLSIYLSIYLLNDKMTGQWKQENKNPIKSNTRTQHEMIKEIKVHKTNYDLL